jgi:hypothetical protein
MGICHEKTNPMERGFPLPAKMNRTLICFSSGNNTNFLHSLSLHEPNTKSGTHPAKYCHECRLAKFVKSTVMLIPLKRIHDAASLNMTATSQKQPIP